MTYASAELIMLDMNNDATPTMIAALRTVLAAADSNGRFHSSAIPYDIAVSLIADRMIDTDGTVSGWEITARGLATLAAAPPAPAKMGLVTVNGETRLVPCDASGKIRLTVGALRREFGIPANAPIVIG